MDVDNPMSVEQRTQGGNGSAEMPTASAVRPLFTSRRGVVPYIASWSGEEAFPVEIVARAEGIAYADETLLDRDDHGVLWSRVPSRPGTGEPRYNTVHPLRQRRAMRRLLCQVCAGPADENEHGTLWLLRDHREDWADWPEGMGNAHPPLCLRCAHISVKACPWLTPGFVAIRARSTITGVSGELFRPGHSGPEFATMTIAYRHSTRRWMQARQLVRTLHDCTLVTL